jgi:hypothetical protein
MTKEVVYALTTFILVFLLHAMYSIWETSQITQRWIRIGNGSLLSLYITRQDFLLGFSYALAVAFTIYALVKFLKNQRLGISGVVGGVTLTGVLYIAGCFLLGCCGSPLIPIYLSLFGASFLGFTKPIIATITTISVAVGYFWISKKSKGCCVGGKGCSF